MFSRVKVVVFCDGDFWHGRNWDSLKVKLAHRANAPYWIAKIQSNIQRDRLTTERLQADGWLVLRVWETDVRSDPNRVAAQIAHAVTSRRT